LASDAASRRTFWVHAAFSAAHPVGAFVDLSCSTAHTARRGYSTFTGYLSCLQGLNRCLDDQQRWLLDGDCTVVEMAHKIRDEARMSKHV
jgi:hypothetical protein